MNEFFRRLALLASCLFVANAFAGVNKWTAVGPDGGYVEKVAYGKSSAAVLYAAAFSGFYRSTDNGTTWQLIRGDLLNRPADIAVDPTNPDHLYVSVGGRGAYESSDAGATLTQLPIFQSPNTDVGGGFFQLEIGSDGRTLYGTSGNDVYRSTDAGQSWSKRTQILPQGAAALITLTIDPQDPNTLYACLQSEGVFVSHDGAQSWDHLNSEPGLAIPLAFAIDASNSQRLWVATTGNVYESQDGGAHWGNRLAQGGSAMAADPLHPGTIYVATIGGAVRSSPDGGITWQTLAIGTPAGYIQSIAFEPGNSSHLLATGWSGVAYSSDGGTTWTPRNSGMKNARVNGFATSPANDRLYFGTEANGIFYLSGGNDAAAPANNESLQAATGARPNNGVRTLAVAPGAQDLLVVLPLATDLAKSTDGGGSFTHVHDALFTTRYGYSVAIAPNSTEKILLGGMGGVLYSPDATASWQAASIALQSTQIVSSIAFAPSAPATVYLGADLGTSGAGATNQFWRSDDGGLTWSPKALPANAGAVATIAVDPQDANIVYATNTLGLLKSANGGGTWSTLDVVPGQPPQWITSVVVDPSNPRVIYAGSVSSDISRSVDAGASWELLHSSQSPPSWGVTSLAIDPNRPYTLLAATNGYAVQQLKIEPDLSVAVNAPVAPLALGAPATFSYSVSNFGPYHATAVRLRLQIPANLTVSSVNAPTATCSSTAGAVTCTWDVLRSAQVAAVTLNVVAQTSGTAQILANLSGAEADPVAANNSASSDASSAEISDLALSVAQASASINPGGTASYAFTISNAGPNAASSVQFNFQPGAGLTVSSATPSSGTCAVNGNGTATCAATNLGAQASATITIVTTAPNAGTIQSTANVATGGVDPANGNNSANVTTTVSAPPTSGKSGGGGGGESAIFVALLLCLLAARRVPRILARSLRCAAYVVQESRPLSIALRLERFR